MNPVDDSGKYPRTLSLRLPAEPASVPQARHAIGEFATPVGLNKERIYDLRTVVTEACANILEHVYGDDEGGIIELDTEIEDGGVTVIVRDHGAGMWPKPTTKPWSLRLGLVLIGTLSSSFECLSKPGKAPSCGCTWR